jgi:hypothetical protein
MDEARHRVDCTPVRAVKGLLLRGEAAMVRSTMYAAVLVTLLAASLGMSQAPGAAGAPVAPRTNGSGDGKAQGPRKGCRDINRANDLKLAGWSQYQPKTSTARKTWKALLLETPADQRTPALLREAWERTGRSEPCFLYLRAMASSEQGDAVDAYRAVRDFLDVDPSQTFADDRTAALQIWEASTSYNVKFAIDGAPPPGTRLQGTAVLEKFATDGAEQIGDDPVGSRYCKDRPDRCADHAFELEIERPVLQLPVGAWRVSITGPFVFGNTNDNGQTTAEVVIRGRPPKSPAGELLTGERPDLLVRYVAPPVPQVVLPLVDETPGDTEPNAGPVDSPGQKRGPGELPVAEISIGGLATITGAVIFGIGAARTRELRGRDFDQCQLQLDQCRMDLGRATNLGTTGAAVLGFGLGTAVTSALWWKASRGEDWKAQRKLRGAVGVGVGAAIAVFGGVALGFGRARFSAQYGLDSAPFWEDHSPSAIRLHAVGGLGLGLGLGLAVTSGINWVVYSRIRADDGRTSRRRASALQVAPLHMRGGGGLALSGRF